MMSRRKKILLWIGVAAAGAVIVSVLASGKPVSVKVVKLEPGELRVIVNATTTSTIKSEFEVTLAAQRTGRVVSLPVREGDRVKEGQLIARLDLTEEQKRAFTPMVEKQEKESYELSRTHRKAVRALVEKSFAAMEKELTPDQRVKLVELRKKLDRHRRFQEPPSQGNGKKAAEP